jgi:glucose/arabinose dehydrogenase
MEIFRRWVGPAAAAAVLLAAGCPSGDGGGDLPPGPPQVALSLERVFPGLPDFSAPLAMLQAPNDPTRWFVVEQGGVVRVFPNLPAVATSSVFIDISDRVAMDGEAGLLGMAFHPDFPGDRRVYLFYSHRDTPNTPPLVSRLSEFTAAIGAATLDPNSERILITLVKNPGTETNHNGGNLAFGPDRLLYAGIGDGGGGNDQHGAFGNAQNPNTLFGKMLRIQPLVAPGTYGIPPGNPFASSTTLCGTNGTGTQPCPEIFAIGLRNPWRWSFDRANGQLWVGDVGQGALEEVDRINLGGNYGWRCFEGTRANTDVSCGVPGPFIPPVAQYGRNVGVTVTGGYVYRGTRFQGLVGRYIFADFGVGTIFSIDATAQGVLNMTDGFASGLAISSFGQGIDGEIFAVDYGGGGLYHIRQ